MRHMHERNWLVRGMVAAFGLPWFQEAILQARASARLVPGYDSPSSRLPLPSSTF